MSFHDVFADGLGQRKPGERPALHTQIEGNVFRLMSAVFPDIAVSVRGKHSPHQLGPEIVISGRIQRFNRVLDYNVAVHTDFMPHELIAEEVSRSLVRFLSEQLMKEAV